VCRQSREEGFRKEESACRAAAFQKEGGRKGRCRKEILVVSTGECKTGGFVKRRKATCAVQRGKRERREYGEKESVLSSSAKSDCIGEVSFEVKERKEGSSSRLAF